MNTDPFVDFCLDRRAMLHAFRIWLQTEPDNALTTQEIEATASALRQLHTLETTKVG